MEKSAVQCVLDRVAVSASALCMVHCLALPVLLVSMPILSSTMMASETFHRALLVPVLPVSVAALFLGCRSHKDRLVFMLGALGLACLILTAWVGHEGLGEAAERAATIVGGLLLAGAHVRNYSLRLHVSPEARHVS